MSAKPISDADEARLVEAVTKVSRLVDDGMDPNPAVAKVVKEASLLPGEVRLICAGFNTGRQAAQRTKAATALTRFASFPLADPDAALQLAFGLSKAAYAPGVDLDRTARPMRVKAAAAVEPEPSVFDYRRKLEAADKQARDLETAHQEVADAEHALHNSLVRLKSWAGKFACDRMPYGLFADSLHEYFGPPGDKLALFLESEFPTLAAEKKACFGEVDLAGAPFDTVRACIANGQRVVAAREKLASLQPPPPPPAPVVVTGPPLFKKKAGPFAAPAFGTMVGTMVSRGVGAADNARDRAVDDAVLSLEDPEHQNELRKIRSQVALNDILSNSDDPISGSDPEQVLDAYNEIAQIAPRSAEHAAVIKPLLRRRLMGQVEPFEAQQLTEIERNVMGNRQHVLPGVAGGKSH